MAETLTPEEEYKFDVINKVIIKELKSGQAAKMLGISTRQIRRLRHAVYMEGKEAIIHKLKGQPSNHKLDEQLREKALNAVAKKYSDFKPTFASEKLEEIESLVVNPQTLRRWMAKEGLWKTRKMKNTGEYHAWRPRKEYYGELEQFDGSYHMWFENRFIDKYGQSIEVCLLASIDDATGKITKAVFAANEGVRPVFNFWMEYIQETGKPLAIYLDSFSTYKINHKSAIDNKDMITQFERAMESLGIKPITAHSPQAKGRIERLFKTLQDRLIKEMRLANINTPEEGNMFLKEVFLPKFNDRFAVIPAATGNVHKDLTEIDRKTINRIFSVQSTRVVNNDFTIQFKTNWYQLAGIQQTTVRAKEKVLVEEWLDDTIHLSIRGYYLKYILLPQKPQRTKKNPTIITTHRLNWIPPEDHPWRNNS